jgi:hypothetical protein
MRIHLKTDNRGSILKVSEGLRQLSIRRKLPTVVSLSAEA